MMQATWKELFQKSGLFVILAAAWLYHLHPLPASICNNRVTRLNPEITYPLSSQVCLLLAKVTGWMLMTTYFQLLTIKLSHTLHYPQMAPDELNLL
jgi:hypothetical protein